MEEERLRITELNELLSDWLMWANQRIVDSKKEVSDLTLEFLNGNDNDGLRERRLQMQEKYFSTNYQVLMIGLLMEIRNGTAETAELLRSGVYVHGDVNASIT